MPASVIAVADAVVAALNGAGLSQPFTAERQYAPKFDIEDLDTLQVTVVPSTLTVTPLARGHDDYEYLVHVAVQKRLARTATTDAAVRSAGDALMTLVEEVVDLFRAGGDFGGARWVGVENAPIYDPDHLYNKQTFTSLVGLRFRESRAK